MLKIFEISRILAFPLLLGGFARGQVAPWMLAPTATGWRDAGLRGIRGITIGPIENAYHPGVGYGTPAYDRTLVESKKMGAEWIAITPFGRVADLTGRGVDLTFEAPFEENRKNIRNAILMAHARGLKVMLVPHLWVESGEWRAKIDPPTDEAWDAWAKSYRNFVMTWAAVAEETHAELMSSGVELRSWVTTTRAPSFSAILHDLRTIYHGMITYSANWDDAENTVILGDLDVIGVNAFFPLADKNGASFADLSAGGEKIRTKIHALAETWKKPVLFTEIGYTTRENCAIEPWLWPDSMKNVKVDEASQANAYHALIAPLLDEPDLRASSCGVFIQTQMTFRKNRNSDFRRAEKLAELVMRDAFAAPWACDGVRGPPWGDAAEEPGLLP